MPDSLSTLQKMLNLIRLLNTPPAKSVAQLQRRLGNETSLSSVYRYLQLLEDIGYPIETDEQHRKYISFATSTEKDKLLPEDIDFIIETLQTVTDNPRKKAILHKLNRNLSLIPLAEIFPQLHISQMLRLIHIAIDNGWCIMIKDYRSVSSQSIRDRHAEPLEITSDNRYLIAWDLDKDRQSQFKIDRMGGIELLHNEKITPNRTTTSTDFFGLTGEDWKEVRIKLGNMAHHLLVEEFPATRSYIRKIKEEFFFIGPVLSWKGIGRFVLGLPGELEVIAPEEFKEYLREKLKKSKI